MISCILGSCTWSRGGHITQAGELTSVLELLWMLGENFSPPDAPGYWKNMLVNSFPHRKACLRKKKMKRQKVQTKMEKERHNR